MTLTVMRRLISALRRSCVWGVRSSRSSCGQRRVLVGSVTWFSCAGHGRPAPPRVNANAGADWPAAKAATLGEGLRSFESGHDLSELCSYLGVGTAIVLTVVLFLRGHVRRGVMIGAVVVSVLFPPWIVPGAGVLVVTIALCIARGRRLSPPREPQPRNSYLPVRLRVWRCLVHQLAVRGGYG